MRVLFTPRLERQGDKPPAKAAVEKLQAAAEKFVAECVLSDTMRFDNATAVIAAQGMPRDVVASELHINIRLSMFDTPEMAKRAGVQSESPLGAVQADVLLQALKSTLPGERPIAGIYNDSDESGGSALVRICISDVSYLYQLRGSLMLGEFGTQLSAALGKCMSIDTADFVAKYQACCTEG